jgi:hypothetical protein
MCASFPVFCALFRHAAIALGQEPPYGKRAAIEALAALAGADPSAFYALLEFREGKRKEKDMDIEAMLHAYLEFVEVATSEVDRLLDRR